MIRKKSYHCTLFEFCLIFYFYLSAALLTISLQGITSNQLFPHDRTFVYDWSVKFNTGAMLPSKMVSEWHMNSKIIIQTSSTITQMQVKVTFIIIILIKDEKSVHTLERKKSERKKQFSKRSILFHPL